VGLKVMAMRNYREAPPEQRLALEETGTAPDELNDFTRKPHLKPHLTQEALDDILGIAPEIMLVNRIGKLTREQRDKILAHLKDENDGMRLLMTIFLGVSLLLAFIFLSVELPMVYLVIGAGIMIGSLLAFFYRQQAKKRVDLETRVQHVDSVPVLRSVGQLDSLQHYMMVIGSEVFAISREAYETLERFELPLCRVYFTARSKQLLSIEVRERYDGEKRKNDLLLDEDEDDEKAKNDDLLTEDEVEARESEK
jgi:hypothetical protein